MLTADRIRDRGIELAGEQEPTFRPSPRPSPLGALCDDAAADLERFNEHLAGAVRLQQPISPASEWLLDNYYLVEEQIRAVRKDLPTGYGRELPRLTSGALSGYPRTYQLMTTLVAHTDARVDEEYLRRIVDGFQDVSPLSIGEVWAIPIMLRVALVDNLRRLAHRVVESHLAARSADEWADRLLLAAQEDGHQLRDLISELDARVRGASSTFVLRLSQRLSGEEAHLETIGAWLERRLAELQVTLEALAHDLQQEQASDQVSIANSITSIRFLDAYEWRSFFEEASFVEQILRQDPVGVYPRMDFKSRDRYRHTLEDMGRRCPLSEIQIAEAAVSWTLNGLASGVSGSVKGHVGHYLISSGRYGFERSIHYRPRTRERFYRSPLANKGLFYWGMLAGSTALLEAVLALSLESTGISTPALVAVLLLALTPLTEIALTITNRTAAGVFPPRILPKLDYLRPVNESHRTLVVIPALLSSVGAVRHVLDNLEVAYLANRDDQIAFGLLGDLKTSRTAHAPGDEEIVEAAALGIEQLNDRYSVEHDRRPFHMFLRGRRHNEAEDAWMGWERKRGSLVELNRLLRGSGETTFELRRGDHAFLGGVTFVLTLDSDTLLPRDAARKLISAIAHPLNRAVYRPGDARVYSGYGLIQPRVGMSLPASSRSYFAWLYSGITGIDPYAGAVSDTYQDVFGEGSFTGKGIYEVNVFANVLEGRFPDNTLLSHDLVEGCFLRVALASDIEVFDDHPANYLSHMARLHRWVRGDWQAARWLLPLIPGPDGATGNPLSALHRWKIVDNLRRSLVPPTLLALIIVGWLVVPGPAWVWPLVVLLLIFFPAYFNLVNSILLRPRNPALSGTASSLVHDLARDSSRASMTLALLPHQSQIMLDAGIRALWRMLVTRRNLLEWETAADADRRLGTNLRGFVHRVLPSSTGAMLLLAPAVLADPGRLLPAITLGVIWAGGPVVAWMVSRTRTYEREPLDAGHLRDLRRIARRTWRFFETFVTPEGHHLAPDNFQEEPVGEVAWRTSPTNIGLQLMAGLAAHDLGYMTVGELISRCADTLSTMAGLEKFRGHFYNWYDIRTLGPLPPKYVSTVDSGNLAGHLLVLRVGLLEASEAPVLNRQLLTGLADTIDLAVDDIFLERDALQPIETVRSLREQLEELSRDIALEEPPVNAGGWYTLLTRLGELVGPVLESAAPLSGVDESPAEQLNGPHPLTAVERAHASLAAIARRINAPLSLLGRTVPWAPMLTSVPPTLENDSRRAALSPLLDYVPSLVGLAEGLPDALAALEAIGLDPPGATESDREIAATWARELLTGIREARPTCVEMLARLRLDADIAREMWEHTDFSMLFDERRLLFSIGYSTSEGALDSSFYDMLASECRLASFLAIAKGDIPQEHWFRLGRAITATDGGRALLSWSASMFEYLMPLLVMRTWPMTLLDQTYRSVVNRQIQYGVERGVPWGVSESAFNAKDAQLTYQYQAFGVPGLGLKRGLSDDIVVAPYASILALPVAPTAVLDNLRAFTEIGARGRYGYYESVDFTPGRIPAGERRALVKAYFAHHQGMSLIAFGNELTDYLMQDRFHRDPAVVSAELLLQERVPRQIQLAHPHSSEVQSVRTLREPPSPVERSYPIADTPVPSTHFLSNGRYSVMVTNGGGGYSRWKDLSVTRYREDVTRDCWGQFIYVRDAESGRVFNTAYNPCPERPDEYHVTFHADKAEFRRIDGELETHTEISVSPEDDVEVRRVTIANRGTSRRTLEVTSYFEIAFAVQGADQAHRSFSNLFVETEALEDHQTICFTRRPRSATETRRFGLHTLACDVAEECDWSYETDRAKFLGRLRAADAPAAVHAGGKLSGTTGAVLDPACAIRQTVVIEPGSSARLVFATGVAATREDALRLAEKYHDIRSAQRAIDLAWTAAQIELRDLGLTPQDAVVLERLGSRLLLTDPYSPLKVKTPEENGRPLSGLWSLGISGDLPILLVRIEDLEHAPLVRQALLAHQYWRHKGLVADLVVLNTRPTSYADELDDRLRLLVRTGHALQLVDKPGGIFLRRADQMHPDILNLLLSVARATLDGDGGSLELQLNRRSQRPEDPDPLVRRTERRHHETPPFERPRLLYDNGYGGFDPDGDEYVIVLDEDTNTPAPWINVMASPRFGCTVSEAGIGCTWAENSHENRITTWNNDAVSDGSGEMLYLRDEESGEYWSPTPLPRRAPGHYTVRHGKGYSRFEHHSHGIAQSIDWFVPEGDPVRVVRLNLRNDSDRPRRLSATQFVEWVLGDSRSHAQHLVVTWYDAEQEILTAHNHLNPDFPGKPAFLACDRSLHSFTCSRTEFMGRNRRPSDPAALRRKGLGGRTGRFHDNCGALMATIDLLPGEEASVTFLLGQANTLEDVRSVVSRFRQPGAVDRALAEAKQSWSEILGTVQVSTPNPALDLLLNGQLVYQTLACRLWGRTATYQSSGAFGFRDQLQDVLALLLSRPDLVREQIVEASRHQFERGDVQHWWQPVSGRGVRTRIVDDRHWLPFVVAEYIRSTGDVSVLDERTAFIEGPELEPDREDNYLQPTVSERAASVYEHCIAALESGRETGAHGLPLMGGGDWNDGMNRVGIEGRGESVWMAWFLYAVIDRFAPVCELRGDHERAEEYRGWAQGLTAAAEAEAWDGSWYRRAYFDDGTPLGSRESTECRIDAIAQAWATICGAADPERASIALDSVEDKLVSREDGIVALLAPPFDHMEHDPGYIKGYVPGVRENGGQYTHAAVWVVLAHLLLGDGDEAHGLLDLINPINHARTREAADLYAVEPYVVAADVYAAPPHVGRGGWTWYTGSASWLYHVAVRDHLGLWVVAEGGTRFLTVDPCIPKSWKQYSMRFRDQGSTYEIEVENPRGVNRGVAYVELDGERLDGILVPLSGDGVDHRVRVVLLGG